MGPSEARALPSLRTAVLVAVLALCWRVGCDGVLDSRTHFDKCGVCGGDNTSCHIISGIFTRRSLPYGYNKVATIPNGACNINITEIMPNRNFLALRLSGGQKYVINGNWVVGASKEYTAAGTTFRYYRPMPSQLHQKGQKEYIISRGPTNASVDIMLLKQQENHGIMYEYTIPMTPSAAAAAKTTKSEHERHRKPNWTKPEVKVKGPLSLTKASDPIIHRPEDGRAHRPADEGARPSQPKVFRPELSDRYQRYSSQFANYLGTGQSAASSGRPTSVAVRPVAVPLPASQAYPQRRTAGTGILDVSRPGVSGMLGTKRASQPRPAMSNLHYNKANGHRLRHRGRHGGRRHRKLADSIALRSPVKQYDYQAHTLGPDQQSIAQPSAFQPNNGPVGAHRYPPVVPGVVPQRAGVVPARLVPIPQSAAQRRPSGSVPYQPPSKYPSYGSQYPHVIPATRQQYPPPRPAPQYPPGRQLYPQGTPLVGGQPLPDNQQHRYDMVYYPQGGATQPQAGSKWALNDQIAQSLPGASRYLLQSQLGNQDPGSDFTWRISGFTECSKTCGGGTQTTIIVCVKGASQAVVTDQNCDNALKPESQAVSCNSRLCPPAWEPTEWSSCSTSCGRGTQTRDAECRQMVSLNDVRPVSAVVCQDLPKPDTVRMCNEDKPCVRWKIGEWGKCSADCGRGQRTREVVCVNSEDRPIAENKCPGTRPLSMEICDMGSCAKTWFYTEWSEECSTSCGEGVYVRKLHCSADSARCAVIRRPEETKVCRNRLPCGGQWFSGPWNKCSVTCGHGVTRRDVICMKRLGRMMPVGEENCLSTEKPEWERPCENPACTPRWYKTDWTKCTKTCDTGYQQRDVKCLDAAQRTTTRCAEEDKHDVWRTCNTMPCPTLRKHSGNADSLCKDEYNNCRLVVQARLCHYAYYKKACCLSCGSGNHGDEHEDDVSTHTDDVSDKKKPEKQHEGRSRDQRRQT